MSVTITPARDPMPRLTVRVDQIGPDSLGVVLMDVHRAGGLVIATVPARLCNSDDGIVPIAYHVYYLEAHQR